MNNYGRTQKVIDLLGYDPIYRHTIPHRGDRRGKPKFPALCIHERAPRWKSSLSIEVSDLIEGTAVELRQLKEDAKEESTGSSDLSLSDSSSSWDVDVGGGKEVNEDTKVEDGEEVNQVKDLTLVPSIAPPIQVPAAEPILVPSLGLEAADDLDFLEVKLVAKYIV